jgi:uncharacterized RDD family membrane protein YckC
MFVQKRKDDIMENSIQQLANRWKRLGGALLDGLIMMVIIFPVMMIFGIFQHASGQGISFGQRIFSSILGLAVFLGLNGYFLAKNGQTIGKKIVKTRIVNLDGELCPFAKMFLLRYLVVWVIAQIPFIGGIFCLVDALVIFGKDKRCIHDYIAGTKVVDA